MDSVSNMVKLVAPVSMSASQKVAVTMYVTVHVRLWKKIHSERYGPLGWSIIIRVTLKVARRTSARS